MPLVKWLRTVVSWGSARMLILERRSLTVAFPALVILVQKKKKKRAGHKSRKRRSERKEMGEWKMKVQDYVMDGLPPASSSMGTACCCWKEVAAGQNPITPDCRPFALLLKWSPASLCSCEWRMEAGWCLESNTTPDRWAPMPVLLSGLRCPLSVTPYQAHRNFLVSGRSFVLPTFSTHTYSS